MVSTCFWVLVDYKQTKGFYFSKRREMRTYIDKCIRSIYRNLYAFLWKIKMLRPMLQQISADGDMQYLAMGSGVAFVFKLISLPL